MIVCWIYYVKQMHGKPLLTSNAAQMVLKYYIVHETEFLKNLHNKMYAFSSATLLARVAVPIEDWIQGTRTYMYALPNIHVCIYTHVYPHIHV